MLMGGEVGKDVKTLILTEDTLEDGVSKVESIGTVVVRDVETAGGPDVARELCQAVLTQVNNDELRWSERQQCLDILATNGTCTAHHAHLLALDLAREQFLVRLNVSRKHTRLPASDIRGDELLRLNMTFCF